MYTELICNSRARSLNAPIPSPPIITSFAFFFALTFFASKEASCIIIIISNNQKEEYIYGVYEFLFFLKIFACISLIKRPLFSLPLSDSYETSCDPKQCLSS